MVDHLHPDQVKRRLRRLVICSSAPVGYAAFRYEQYSEVGAVSSPQLALVYHPIDRVLLRGTWARLGHAPELPDLSEVDNVSTLTPLPISAGGYAQTYIPHIPGGISG